MTGECNKRLHITIPDPSEVLHSDHYWRMLIHVAVLNVNYNGILACTCILHSLKSLQNLGFISDKYFRKNHSTIQTQTYDAFLWLCYLCTTSGWTSIPGSWNQWLTQRPVSSVFISTICLLLSLPSSGQSQAIHTFNLSTDSTWIQWFLPTPYWINESPSGFKWLKLTRVLFCVETWSLIHYCVFWYFNIAWTVL